MKPVYATLAIGALLAVGLPAAAQDTSFTPTTVWDFTQIKVEPGQFQNYMDYLSGTYRKNIEYQEKLGRVVSYHILQVNDARKDDPDLILAVEYKDYETVAESLDMQKKMMAFMATDPHKATAASGERVKMRTTIGSMELQELKFK